MEDVSPPKPKGIGYPKHRYFMTELSDFHSCIESEGKIVCISIDNLGITRCNYCNQIVDYSIYFKYKEAERRGDKISKQGNDRARPATVIPKPSIVWFF